MPSPARILVIDDDELVNDFIQEALRRMGHVAESASNAEEGLREIRERSFDIVFTDVRMPGASGMEVLKQVKERFPETMVIMVTAFGTVQLAVDAMKAGAFEFMLKPCSPEQIEMVTVRALEFRRLRSENEMLRREQKQRSSVETIIGESKKLRDIFRIVASAAPQDSTVLITGESGTGKELIARAVHFNSRRADGPLVSINCAAVPENLIETELFGHEKGAFTGAFKTTRGRFEVADGGTFLLDEIGEMPLKLQTKLLRVLQNHEFERVGSTESIKVDVRIVATTNRNLESEVATGRFRGDLYYRLSVIPIVVPPLRDRREDVPLLVEHFIKRFAEQTHKAVTGIEDSALRMLCEYAWPGNIRELANVIERAVVITENRRLTREDFPLSLAMGGHASIPGSIDNVIPLSEMEKRAIIRALEINGGNRTKSALQLGIAVRTLRNKINEYGLRSTVAVGADDDDDDETSVA
jgi:two-component system response regulator HydG